MATHSFHTQQLDRLCNEVLTSIEIEEARLLHWGFIRVQSDLTQELRRMLDNLHPYARPLWDEAQQAGITPDDIIANLTERKLIFKSNNTYRSRFAETVRLLYLLRQRFTYTDWQTAKRLVSDMRIQLQRRRYPTRDIPGSSVLNEIQNLGASELYKNVIDQLLHLPDGSAFDLAQFQVEAILQQFRNLTQRSDRALVIGAGTGAGKTKAFYIPALAEIATTITTECTTKALAIYPRIELLKDQLAEAYGEVCKLDGILTQQHKRPITLGAYYADTPISAKMFLEHPEWYQSWLLTDSKDGWVCPYMPCPNCRSGELVWKKDDIADEVQDNRKGTYGHFARLYCQSCGAEVNSQHLILTREHMVALPPDILFTTTEMLNRRLSRSSEHALFGIGVTKPPRMVLLDEIHTYEGMTGVQVAYLLRRWRYARGSHPQHNVCFVGLSATLAQAEHFFAQLTGIPLYQVQYISPRDEDQIEEGIEYNLVLKGDPVSGTSLLSTSVQTAMLLGRILDPMPSPVREPVSRGAYGHKVFAFTDKLDVINRWYHIEYDAEIRKVLSQYREQDTCLSKQEQQKINESGQRWWICERVGHDLKTPLILDLTSSQYRGVRSDANLVIATSTLEVGFNDAMVGAVIQHKSPRSLASFLQRKGRAGRTRAMRPWMVVVTSAYGRDRWAFQHAETLFNPTLRPIDLPLENTYVRKIQAAFALMDWLARVLKKQGDTTDIWDVLSSSESKRTPYLQTRRQRVCKILEAVLQYGERMDEFIEYLQGALGLHNDTQAMHAILWNEPRPLLLEVLPTLLRQLESNWQKIDGEEVSEWSDTPSNSPMPDFVPANLFSALNVPELVLHIPGTPKHYPFGKKGQPSTSPSSLPVRDDEYVPLALGMVEFAPGNVSKRYACKDNLKEAHWLELPEESVLVDNKVQLKDIQIELDEIPQQIEIDGHTYQVYRPRAYTLGLVPKNVRSTSRSNLIWLSHFEPQQQGSEMGMYSENDDTTHQVDTDNNADTFASHLALAPDSTWHRFFPSITAYLQTNGAWVEVSRLAIGVQLDTRYEKGKSRRCRLDFAVEEYVAALGFSSHVDALKFEFLPLDTQCLLNHSSWKKLYQHLGPAYFLYCLQNDKRMAEENLSTFEIGWLWQLMLSMLVATAIAKQCTLNEALEQIHTNVLPLAERTLQVIFQTQQQEEDEESKEETGQLYNTILDHLKNHCVRDALFDNATVLWTTPDSKLEAWLQKCYASSLGAILFASVIQLVPDIDPDELVMDIDTGAIWISEETAGGLGLVTKIADAITQHPHQFDLQMLDTIQNCDREQLAIQLRVIATLLDESYDVLDTLFEQARNATDIPTQQSTRQLLTRTLEEHGIPATRELIVALNTKFLRPNSGKDTDKLVAMLVRHWTTEEQRLGCDVDLRVLAVAARQIPEIEEQVKSVLQRIGGSTSVDESQIFNLFQSLLWLTCKDSCPNCIDHYFPYQENVRPSRALLMALLEPDTEPIIYGLPEWDKRVSTMLEERFHCQVVFEQNQREACKVSLLNKLMQPIEIGFQFFYPVVERLVRRGKFWFVDLVIRELIRA